MRKIAAIIGIVGLVIELQAASGTNLSVAPKCITLPDQFEKQQKLAFPNPNLTLLTIADRKGADQIAGWVEPVAKQFGTNVNVRGIADVSAVPWWLRRSVRAEFSRQQSYSVMMDWSGDTVRKFNPTADAANVLVIDRDGKILRRFVGVAGAGQIEELCKLLERNLPTPDGGETSE